MTETKRTPLTWTTGTALSATNLMKMPRGMVAFEDNVSDYTGITTSQEICQILSVAIEAGRMYKITCEFGDFWASSAAGTIEARLFIDGTLRHSKSMYTAASVSVWTPTPTLVRLWPVSSGTTMDLSMQVAVSGGAPSLSVYSDSDAPFLMLCEDIGPSS